MAKETKKDNKNSKENRKFFKEFKAELKRVSWPTLKQLVNNTVAVLAIVLTLAIIVFVLDVIFENLNTFGVEKLKAIVTSSSDETGESGDNVTEEGSGENSEGTENQAEVSNEAGTKENGTSDEAVQTEEGNNNAVENGESSEENN